MKIRPAEKSDVRALMEIFNYEAEHSTASFAIRPQSLEERMEWFYEHSKPAYPLIVAEEDGKTAGYASLSPYRSGDAYAQTAELSVYVDHRFRRKKIGEALIKEILAAARKNERIHTVISVITGENTASICLHRKLGFTYCGTLKEVGRKFGEWLDTEYYEQLV